MTLLGTQRKSILLLRPQLVTEANGLALIDILRQTDKNLEYLWVFGEFVVSLQP